MKLQQPTVNLIVLRAQYPVDLAKIYEALGCRFVTERHGGGPEHLSADLGGITLEIYPRASAQSTSGLRIGFIVSDLEAVIAGMVEKGAGIVRNPEATPWGYRAVLEDTEGHRIEVTAKSLGQAGC